MKSKKTLFRILILLPFIIAFNSCLMSQETSNTPQIHSGEFIMMPENEAASFRIDFDKETIEIKQGKTNTSISLQPMLNFNNRYFAPEGKVFIKEKSKVIHISKDVFNKNDSIEVLFQSAYTLTEKEETIAFVLDFIISENGDITLAGSTNYKGSSQGSMPIFAMVDGEAFYGINKRIEKGYLRPYQILNAKPHILDAAFTNGTMVFEDNSWGYCKANNISVEACLKQKQTVIDRLIGPKDAFLIINHTIYYDGAFSEENKQDTVKTKVVSTYNDPYYSDNIKELIKDLANGNTVKAIPVLMHYVNDDRSLDLPADDYGSNTVSSVAIYTLSEIWRKQPEFFINYKEKNLYQYGHEEMLLTWWDKNKQFYE